MAKTTSRTSAKTEELKFTIPSFFSDSQLFGSSIREGKKTKEIIFNRNGNRLKRHVDNPKQAALDYARKINANSSKKAIVRLTLRGVPPKAYVAINLESQKQVDWAATQRKKMEAMEQQRHGKGRLAAASKS